jgi:putative membrane protein
MTALRGWELAPFPAGAITASALVYAAAVRRVATRGVSWPHRHSSAFGLALAVIGVAIVSPLAAHDERFPVHVIQHLLLGMLAPLLFALAAPITLLLRTLPPGRRRPVVRVLHSRPLKLICEPVVAGALNVAGLFLVYLTPVYAATLTHPLLHDAIHLHFLVIGCLFTWSLVALDPIPRRSFPLRTAVLALVLALHATLAKLLYAQGPAASGLVPNDLADWRLGTQIMWYGGDAVDVLLLVAFFGQWYRVEGRKLARQRRRLAT